MSFMVEKMNGDEVKQKIINFLRTKGPSLPIHIAKETNLNTLFASAFLSELSSEKALKISNLKVGGSPLYYLEETVGMLENFYSYLPGKEKEAFLMLKTNLILQDNELHPAIRVSLRNIKDFSFPFTIKTDNQEILFWRYFKINEQEAKEKAEEKISKSKPKIIQPQIQQKPIPQIQIKQEQKEKITKEFRKDEEKPILKTKEKKEKIKEESSFVKKVKEQLEQANIEILEEKEKASKELQAVVRVDSNVGKIMFFVVIKDKKAISDTDLAVSLQKAQGLKLPLLFLSDGKPNKKAETYLQEWKTLIKFRSLRGLNES